jgi:transposase
MRGRVDAQGVMFHAFHIEDFVPANHPLRSIKARADRILKAMSPDFNRAYTKHGAPSIPPERLIKALLLRALYSIRSETQLVEQIRYNFLFRWFLDLQPTDGVWVQETFTMNRRRFEEHGLVRKFFDRVVADAILEGLVSEDHFSVDGTLIESYASIKSLRPIDQQDQRVSDGSDDDDPGNPTVNFRGEKRSNKTHRSVTDGEARLARKGKGQPAKLSHGGHVLMENRNGLCMDIAVDDPNSKYERLQAAIMLERTYKRHRLWPKTLGADGNYKEGAFLAALEGDGITPHVPLPNGPIRGEGPASTARRRAKRRMTTKGYAISQRIRKRAEEVIGWCKTVGGLARAWFIGRWKLRQQSEATAAAYNLLRMARLAPAG